MEEREDRDRVRELIESLVAEGPTSPKAAQPAAKGRKPQEKPKADKPPEARPGPAQFSTAEVPAPETKLKSRIDPASIIVNWDFEAAREEEGPEAVFGRPRKDLYVRAHPEWSIGGYMIDCQTVGGGLNSEYILTREVAQFLLRRDQPVTAIQVYLLAVYKGGYRYWPVKIGDPTTLHAPAPHVTSALDAVAKAREGWVKVFWKNNVGKSGWKILNAEDRLPDPQWPEDPLDLFLDSIKDRYLDDINDPVIQAYIGAAG